MTVDSLLYPTVCWQFLQYCQNICFNRQRDWNEIYINVGARNRFCQLPEMQIVTFWGTIWECSSVVILLFLDVFFTTPVYSLWACSYFWWWSHFWNINFVRKRRLSSLGQKYIWQSAPFVNASVKLENC